MDLSIIIPTYNERDNIREMVGRTQAVLKSLAIQYEIWFIDDSRDDTPALLEQISKQYPEVHYVHRTEQRGLGTAVVEGFKRSCGDSIIVMDADLQHPPELLPDIIAKLQSGAEVVIPSRFIAGGSDGGLNVFRKLVSWVARTIGRIAIKRFRNVTDCTGGYFGLKRTVIANATLNPTSWKILMEVLVKGHYTTITEIPYHFVSRDAGKSKMTMREQWNYLRHIFSLIQSSPSDRRFVLYCFGGFISVVLIITFGYCLT